MSFSIPTGKPGVQSTYTASPRNIFLANPQFAQYLPGPITVDGNLASNPLNAPYTWLLWAGTAMGRIAATGKYRNSIIGFCTGAVATADTTLTSDAGTVAEIARLITFTGGSVALKITGPAAAGGTVNTRSLTASSAAGTTITLSAAVGGANAFISGSLITPADGSETPTTLLCDTYGLQIADRLHAARTDVYDARLLSAGPIINTGMLVNYPGDPALRTYVKTALRAAMIGVQFSDDVL